MAVWIDEECYGTMATNKRLNKASKAKKDEFYTSYDDIQSEINNFEDAFAGKTVLCNCDDPFESAFSKFFLRNFNYLKFKTTYLYFICWKSSSWNTNVIVRRLQRTG